MATYEELRNNGELQAYDELKKKYNQMADTNAKNQLTSAQSSAKEQLRQAYINNIQNQRQVAQNLATAGIRGGATQTANVQLATAYGNNRASINSDLAGSINNINNQTMQNKNQYALETDSAMRQYVENRGAEDRQNAREDEQITYQRNTDKYTAKYSKFHSVDELKKKLKAATDPLEKQIINARIGYIRSHKKGY